MKLRTICWLVVPLLLGVVAYLAAAGHLRRFWSSVVLRGPAIDYPVKLDLGQREIGDQAVASFTIANRGGDELLVDQVTTNCSCTGMERKEDGRYVRVESLRLKAGEQADLVMRVSVRGVPVGAEMVNVVEFKTNDPAQPGGRIEAVVRVFSGSVTTSPKSVVFGTVPIGAKVRDVVDVRDWAVSLRAIERVTSTSPDRVTARVLPVEDGPGESDPEQGGALIGRIEIVVDTGSPGDVNAAVHIQIAGQSRPPDAVKVVGRVAAPIEMSPTLLVLPRASSSGPLYTGSCIVRSTNGKPLTLTVDSLPPGLTAEVLAEDNPASRTVQITWDPQRGTLSPPGQRQQVRFRARAGEGETVLELPVLLQMPGG